MTIDRCGSPHPTIPGLVCYRMAGHVPANEHGGRRDGETRGTTWTSGPPRAVAPAARSLVSRPTAIIIDDPHPNPPPTKARVHPDDLPHGAAHLMAAHVPSVAAAAVLARDRPPTARGGGMSRPWHIPAQDPYHHTLRLCLAPGERLFGAAVAMVLDQIATAWTARPDASRALLFQIPALHPEDAIMLLQRLALRLGCTGRLASTRDGDPVLELLPPPEAQ